MLRRLGQTIRVALRRYFVAGVLAVAPIGITLWATVSIVKRLDSLLLPKVLKIVFPGVQDPPTLPLVGALFTLVVILLAGVIARHLFGFELLRISERFLLRVPLARNIYAAVKQLFEAIFQGSAGANRFNRVVLVEYPRKGVWAIAFTTGTAHGAVQDWSPETLVNVFVPTTPNPTSGFYLLVPEDDLKTLPITVEQAFKLVMSAGLVSPDEPGSEPAVAESSPEPAPALTARTASEVEG